MVATRIPFRTQARAGAVALLEAFKADMGITLQIYRARPRSVKPPTAFVDRISETLVDFVTNGPGFGYQRQRTPVVEVVVVHGLFDSGEATDQGDAFVDAFLDWIADRPQAFGANTEVTVTGTEDQPAFVPDWLPPAEQQTYYATTFRLEGFAAT